MSMYLFIMYLIPIIVGMITVSASAYGLGKHEKNKDSVEYSVSLVFLIIGLVISVATIAMWQQGNYVSNKYKLDKERLEKGVGIGKDQVEKLKECRTEIVKIDSEKTLAEMGGGTPN